MSDEALARVLLSERSEARVVCVHHAGCGEEMERVAWGTPSAHCVCPVHGRVNSGFDGTPTGREINYEYRSGHEHK